MTRAPAALSSSCTIGASRQRLTASVHWSRSSGALDLELNIGVRQVSIYCRHLEVPQPIFEIDLSAKVSVRAGSHLLQARNTRRLLFS